MFLTGQQLKVDKNRFFVEKKNTLFRHIKKEIVKKNHLIKTSNGKLTKKP